MGMTCNFFGFKSNNGIPLTGESINHNSNYGDIYEGIHNDKAVENSWTNTTL